MWLTSLLEIDFSAPQYFWLLLLIPIVLAWYIFYKLRHRNVVIISTTLPFGKANKGIRYYLKHVPVALRCLAIFFVVVALARPRSTSQTENIQVEGIDIMLALDISTSMLAQDFKPDRIEASKDISMQFISERPNDRLGLVVFAGESFTQCPLTTDRITLINLVKEIKTGMIKDGTAIGNGLATAVNRLKESTVRSKVIILLTDGVNNSGEVSPLTAADLAVNYGIRVYTIGVGTMGMAPYPVPTPFGIQIQNMKVEIDEPVLKEISKKTGGEYFRATSNTKLKEIYAQINQLEKTKFDHDFLTNYKEEYYIYGNIALLCLLLEFLIRYVVLRRIP